MLTLTAAGQPSTTMTLRRIQLAKMARDIGGDPADVTAEKLVAWFGSQPGWKIETRRNYRAAVRGFFPVGLPDQATARSSRSTSCPRYASDAVRHGRRRTGCGARRSWRPTPGLR
jgi:hypothetical protein